MFRREILSIFLIAGLSVLGVHSVNAQQIVIGQDDPAVDVQAVQAAVSLGGEILLKGIFDFGERGSVTLTKDVEIIGERDPQGDPTTKIKGGFRTFFSPLPPQLPPQVPGPNITIQGIHFDGTQAFPIYLAYCSGATIKENKITNVRPIVINPPMKFSFGIKVGTNWIQPTATRKYQPGAITGVITIVENDLDMANETPEKTLGQGIFVNWATGITLRILGNKVKNCSRNSIEVMDNYLSDGGSGSVVIRDNRIITAKVGIPVPSPLTPIGILAGWFFDRTGAGASKPRQNMKHTIAGNTIKARGETSIGIWIASNEALVEDNEIITEKRWANPIRVSSAKCRILENKIHGMGTTAIYISPIRSLTASNNKVKGNNVTTFKASVTHVYLGKNSKDNIVAGSSGTAKDLGIDNQIDGLIQIAD